MYFNVNFNVFFKLIKVHLLVSELYVYQNAQCNDKMIELCFEDVKYCSNKKAWMTTPIFMEFLGVLEASVGVQVGSILVIVDNYATFLHSTSYLWNVKFMYYR